MENSINRRNVIRAITAGGVGTVAGCLGFGPDTTLEYCSGELDKPCEGTDIRKDVLEFENVLTSEKMFPSGRPYDAAAVVASTDRVTIYGWAVGGGDPDCREFNIKRVNIQDSELEFVVKSDTNFPLLGGSCRQDLGTVYYRAEISTAVESLDSVRVTHINDGPNQKPTRLLDSSIDI
jgi:hypothetical protein